MYGKDRMQRLCEGRELGEARPDISVLEPIQDVVTDFGSKHDKAVREIIHISDPAAKKATYKVFIDMLELQKKELDQWIREAKKGMAAVR